MSPHGTEPACHSTGAHCRSTGPSQDLPVTPHKGPPCHTTETPCRPSVPPSHPARASRHPTQLLNLAARAGEGKFPADSNLEPATSADDVFVFWTWQLQSPALPRCSSEAFRLSKTKCGLRAAFCDQAKRIVCQHAFRIAAPRLIVHGNSRSAKTICVRTPW